MFYTNYIQIKSDSFFSALNAQQWQFQRVAFTIPKSYVRVLFERSPCLEVYFLFPSWLHTHYYDILLCTKYLKRSNYYAN